MAQGFFILSFLFGSLEQQSTQFESGAIPQWCSHLTFNTHEKVQYSRIKSIHFYYQGVSTTEYPTANDKELVAVKKKPVVCYDKLEQVFEATNIL